MASRFQPSDLTALDLPGGMSIDFDVDAFDDAIRSKGVLFEHHSGMRCPVGVIDRNDTMRRPHEHHESCSSGFIYTRVGSFQGLLASNGLSVDIRDQGGGDNSTASLTAPRFYSEDDCKPVADRIYLAPYDRLYYRDENILVKNWELVDAHLTGVDRLSFPVVAVLGDIVDNRGVRYPPGSFSVSGGRIVWAGPDQPGQDPDTGRGRVYSATYLYRPFFYIKSMTHEIRVTQISDPVDGDRRLEKMPQSCVVVREYVFLNQERDSESASDARQVREPADGSFGAR
jgi:hypothetical protein